jgi:hypothetical protein
MALRVTVTSVVTGGRNDTRQFGASPVLADGLHRHMTNCIFNDPAIADGRQPDACISAMAVFLRSA